jgi:hypothetical protein
MLRFAPLALALVIAAPAIALEQSADGSWMCGVGGESFAALTIAGTGYSLRDLADMTHAGTLEVSADGLQYVVTSGALRDVFHVLGLSYNGAARLNLVLLYNEGIVGLGDCRRT